MTDSSGRWRDLDLLLDRVLDGLHTEEDSKQFNNILRADAEACRHYISYIGLHGRLIWEDGAKVEGGRERTERTSGEWSVESGEPSLQHSGFSIQPFTPAPGFPSTAWHATIGYFSQGMPLAYLLATVITGLGLLIGSLIHVSHPEQVASSAPQPTVVEPKREFVGRITGMANCKWEKEGLGVRGQGSETEKPPSNIQHPTSHVALGDKLALASGLMEITYNTGAKVILQGPVTYEVDSNGGYLSVGKLTGKLEKKNDECKMMNDELRTHLSGIHPSSFILHPFSIRTPTATVIDLGTEFGVEVSESGVTETSVFAGAVQVARIGGKDAADESSRVIRAGQFARVVANEAAPVSVGHRRPDAMTKCFVRAMPDKVSATDAYADLVLSMKPFAYYRMERPKDPKDSLTVFDFAAGGHHGKLHLADEYGGDPWRPGRFGTALSLRGRDVAGDFDTKDIPVVDAADYVDIRDFPSANANQLSVSAWVYTLRRGWWAKIGWEGTSDQFHFGLYESDGDLMAGVVQRNGVEACAREGASNPFPLGQWQHVAFVADGSILHLYRNGVEVAALPCKGVHPVPSIRQLAIGCQNFADPADPAVRPGCCWRGRIDELAIFYHDLSAEQIWRLFKGDRAIQRPKNQGTPSNDMTTGQTEE